MDFLKYISTPHSVYTENSPMKTIWPITKGQIVHGWIYFPSGPAGLLHVIVKRAKTQLFPMDTGQSYRLDDCIVLLNGNYWIDQPPYKLTIETWNESTTYDHAISIGLSISDVVAAPKKKSFISKFLNKND